MRSRRLREPPRHTHQQHPPQRRLQRRTRRPTYRRSDTTAHDNGDLFELRRTSTSSGHTPQERAKTYDHALRDECTLPEPRRKWRHSRPMRRRSLQYPGDLRSNPSRDHYPTTSAMCMDQDIYALSTGFAQHQKPIPLTLGRRRMQQRKKQARAGTPKRTEALPQR